MQQLGYSLFIQICGCIASYVSVTMVALLLDAFSEFIPSFSIIIVHAGGKKGERKGRESFYHFQARIKKKLSCSCGHNNEKE